MSLLGQFQIWGFFGTGLVSFWPNCLDFIVRLRLCDACLRLFVDLVRFLDQNFTIRVWNAKFCPKLEVK